MNRKTIEKERELYRLKQVMLFSWNDVERKYRNGSIDDRTWSRYQKLWHWSAHRFSSKEQDRFYRQHGLLALNRRIARGAGLFKKLEEMRVEWVQTPDERRATAAVHRSVGLVKKDMANRSLVRQLLSYWAGGSQTSPRRPRSEEVQAAMRFEAQVRLATQMV